MKTGQIDEIIKEIDPNYIKCKTCKQFKHKNRFSIIEEIDNLNLTNHNICNRCIQLSDVTDERLA